jgi:hypothetical protein
MVDHASDGQVHGQAFFKASREVPGGNPSVGRIIGPMGSAILGSGVDSLGPSVGQQQAISAAIRAVAQGQYQATEKALTPYRQEQVLKGMQAVAMGQTINQVAAERPAYATLFGDTDATLGAKLYAKATKGQEVIKGIQEAMPELRKLGPDQARQAILKHVNSVQTGDTAVDTEIQTKLMESFPGLMDTYTKQAIQYQQERLTAAQRGFMDMAGQEVQSFMANASMTGESKADLQRALSSVARWDQAVQPLPGQRPEIWQKNLIDSLTLQIEAIGEQEAYLKEDGTQGLRTKGAHGIFALLHHSQVVQQLPEAERQRLMDKAELAFKKATPKYMEPFAKEIAVLKTRVSHPGPGDNVNAMMARLQEISDQSQRLSGSPYPLFDANDTVAMQSQMAVNIARKKEEQLAKMEADRKEEMRYLRDKRDRAEAEALKELIKEKQLLDLTNLAKADPVAFERQALLNGMSADQRQQVYARVFTDPTTPRETQDLVIRNSGVVPKIVQATYEPGAREILTRPLEEVAKSSDQFMGIITQYRDLEARWGADKAAQAFGGADKAKALRAGMQALDRGADPKEATMVAQRAFRGYTPPRASQAELKQTKEAIKEYAGYGFFSIFVDKTKGQIAQLASGLKDGGSEAFQADVYTRAKEIAEMENISVEKALPTAFTQMLSGETPKYAIIGGQAVPSMFNGERSFVDALVYPKGGAGVPLDKAKEAMDGAIEKAMEKYPLAKMVDVMHQSGGSTIPHIMIRVMDSSGNVQKVSITDQDVQNYYKESMKPKESTTGVSAAQTPAGAGGLGVQLGAYVAQKLPAWSQDKAKDREKLKEAYDRYGKNSQVDWMWMTEPDRQ